MNKFHMNDVTNDTAAEAAERDRGPKVSSAAVVKAAAYIILSHGKAKNVLLNFERPPFTFSFSPSLFCTRKQTF